MSNIEDIENVRSFLFKLKDGTELRLVEKRNYENLVKRIKELEEDNNSWKKYCNEDLEKQITDLNNKNFELEYNSIPVQKVKDAIEEIENIKKITSKEKYTHLELLQFAIIELKNLLEEK